MLSPDCYDVEAFCIETMPMCLKGSNIESLKPIVWELHTENENMRFLSAIVKKMDDGSEKVISERFFCDIDMAIDRFYNLIDSIKNMGGEF